MASVRSQSSLSGTAPGKSGPAVAVSEVHVADDVKESQRIETHRTQSGHTTLSRTSSYKVTHVYDTARSIIRRILGELDDVDEHHFTSTTYDSYLEYIADERLVRMPHKGSHWDNVLKSAEFFGVEIHLFSKIVGHFVHESHSISLSALANLRLLLEVCTNSKERRSQDITNIFVAWSRTS